LADGHAAKDDGHTTDPNIISYLYRLLLQIDTLGMAIGDDVPIVCVPRRGGKWVREIVEDGYRMCNQHTIANMNTTCRP
jgi:hypothetical protein